MLISYILQDERFHLPGNTILYENKALIEVVLIGAGKCPYERPKKQQDHCSSKRNDTLNKSNL